MNSLKKTYPSYDNWLSKNMDELRKAVAHLPMEETSDIIEVAGRLIWLAAQQQEGYVMVPVEPIKEKLKEIEEKCFEHPDCFGIDCPLDVIYRAIVGEME